MTARLGSVFSGYSGLERGIAAVLDVETAWVCDNDPGAAKILAHRYPDVPNLGDITAVDWSAVEPVDVLTGGFPCQPVSHAGKRLGDQDERWLWDDLARAVGVLRPRYVLLENVRGLLSAGRGRLFGRVLGDLAFLRYDARWVGLRAADVGAPHGRFRIFVLATDAGCSNGERWAGAVGGGSGARGPAGAQERHRTTTPDASDERHERGGAARRRWAGSADGGRPATDTASDAGRLGHGDGGAAADADRERHGRGQDARSLGRVDSGTEGQARQRERARPESGDRGHAATADADSAVLGGERRLESVRRDPDRRRGQDVAWGAYEPAIRRWEHVLGRPAPAPTQPGRTGNPQLSPRFVEWLMGLPDGWVTDVPGLTRNAQLKALGNGVVPQQAAAALTWLLEQADTEAVA